MSLRQARFKDHWRHVFSRTYPTRFTNLTFRNLYCLGDGTVVFSAGVSAIVGSNGVGKSTLVAAIAQLLASDPSAVEQAYGVRLAGSVVEGTVFCENTELHLSVDDRGSGDRALAGDTFEGQSRWLDPSALASRCLHQIQSDKNFDDLLEPVTPLHLPEDDT